MQETHCAVIASAADPYIRNGIFRQSGMAHTTTCFSKNIHQPSGDLHPTFPNQSLKIGSISPCFLNHKVKQKSLYKIIERAPLPQLRSPRLKSPYLHHWTTALLMASDRSPAIEGLSPLQPRCGPFSPWTYPAEEKRWDNMG